MKFLSVLRLYGLVVCSGAMYAQGVANSDADRLSKNSITLYQAYDAGKISQVICRVNEGASKLSSAERISLADAYMYGKLTAVDGMVQYPDNRYNKRGVVYKIAPDNLYSELREMCAFAQYRKRYKQDHDADKFLSSLRYVQLIRLFKYCITGNPQDGQKEIEETFEELRAERRASRLYAFITHQDLEGDADKEVIERIRNNRRNLLSVIKNQNDAHAIVGAASRALQVEGHLKHRLRRLSANITDCLSKKSSGSEDDKKKEMERHHQIWSEWVLQRPL
ncbi:MAG TPA: hypothetical protein VGT41_06500 [Candidatus Babeliales bacterium]|nr:hypothetical protein [Candidatus Babeliales bacterium]